MDLTDDPLATIDSEEFEADIDRAIDELFVQKGPAPEAGAPAEEAAEKPATETPEKPAAAAPEEPAAPGPTELLEPLKESLLSLDWEITTENIRGFEKELLALQEKLAEDRHSAAVIKMTLGVLKYLHATKYAATPISIQFLHAATRSLDLFAKEPSPPETERQQVMHKLLGQFRRLKAEIRRVKLAAPREAPPAVEALPEALPPGKPEAIPVEEAPAVKAEREAEVAAEAPEPEELAPEVAAETPAEEELVAQAPAAEVAEAEPAVAEEAAPPGLPAEEISAAELTTRAREQVGQLNATLAALTEEASGFFVRLLRAVADKPGLEKVANLLDNVRQGLEGKLEEARNLSNSLAETVTHFEHVLVQPEASGAGGQADLDLHIREVQDIVNDLGQAVSSLAQCLGGLEEPAAPEPEGEAAEAAAETPTAEPEAAEVSLAPAEGEEPVAAAKLVEAQEELAAAAEEPSRPRTLYLANVAGNTLGIPTEAVANVYKVSGRKAKALRKRGYVKLADFKAAFRSLKRGLSGPLAQQKVKELKKLKFPFITLSPEVVGTKEPAAKVAPKGVVLLSTGELHGALLTDEHMQRTPYDIVDYREAGLPGEVSGTATIEGDFEINVIDPDYVLS